MIPKFRAWLKNDKEMIDADEIHFDNGQLDFIGDAITFMRMADEVELMQSTGLFDKNGQEIFEGDILKSNKYTTSVFYERGAYRVKLRRTLNTTVTMDVISFIQKYKTKIVGNIYENPELLEADYD